MIFYKKLFLNVYFLCVFNSNLFSYFKRSQFYEHNNIMLSQETYPCFIEGVPYLIIQQIISKYKKNTIEILIKNYKKINLNNINNNYQNDFFLEYLQKNPENKNCFQSIRITKKPNGFIISYNQKVIIKMNPNAIPF